MKHALGTIGFLCVWAVLSLALASQWMAHPDLFPQLPAPLWQWVDSWYETRNAEQVADMEFIVALALSSAAVLIVMLGGVSVLKQRRRVKQGGQGTQ